MKTIYKTVTALILISLASNHSFATNRSDIVKEIEFDFETFYSIPPKESASILGKYKRNDSKYSPIFKHILMNSKEHSEEVVYGTIIFSAILEDNRNFERIKEIYKTNDKFIDAIRFYYYMIGYNKADNLGYLQNELNVLVAHPNDRILITFLAFLEDVDIALNYLDKLIPNSDGAMAELCDWTVNYLYYTHEDNIDLRQKIESSYSYRIFKKHKKENENGASPE